MNSPDVVNGAFEMLGAVAIWGNVRRILRDKMLKGVDWRVTLFFSAWGYWNLFYYPHLGQWFSFAGGLALVAGNTVWVALALKYRHGTGGG